jgi:hypothetical protein
MDQERLWRHRLMVERLESFDPPVATALMPHLNESIERYRAEMVQGGAVTIEERLERHRRYVAQLGELPPVVTWKRPDPLVGALPERFGIKGGYARHSLFQHVHGNEYPVALRDVDLVRFSSKPDAQDRYWAEKFMPVDFERGAEIEFVPRFEPYFATRDLTVNEVIWRQGECFASSRAVLDMAALELRPVKVRHGTLHRPPTVLGRTVLKLVRLAVEGADKGVPWRVCGLPPEVDVGEFAMAIEFGKSLERGPVVAFQFIRALDSLGLLPAHLSGERATIENVFEDLKHYSIGLRAALPRSLGLSAGKGE